MKTILVCYEQRPTAERVLERSAELALALPARLIVTSVAPVIAFAGRGVGPVDPTDPPSRHERELAHARARLAELGVESVETITGLGAAGPTIVELAEERDVDLIVLGAHEGGLLSRLLEGSTSDEVAHKATADVLVVH